MVAYRGHSSLNPELSQFIPSLSGPQAAPFNILISFLHPKTLHRVWSVGSTPTNALAFAANLSCLKDIFDRFWISFIQRGASFGSLRGASSELGAAVSIYLRWIACLGGKKTELSPLNDGTATGASRTTQQCITAWTRVGCVTFNNGGTATLRVSHYTTVHYGLNESRVRDFQ